MPNVKTSSIGDVIKHYRKLKDMTQEELAELLDLSYQQIQKYEYNKTIPPLEKLSQLSKILEIPIELFFKESSRHNLIERIEADIEKEYEAVKILKENPELQEIIRFYSKHKSNLKNFKLLRIMKDYLKTPQKKREEFLIIINKISQIVS